MRLVKTSKDTNRISYFITLSMYLIYDFKANKMENIPVRLLIVQHWTGKIPTSFHLKYNPQPT